MTRVDDWNSYSDVAPSIQKLVAGGVHPLASGLTPQEHRIIMDRIDRALRKRSAASPAPR